VATIADLHTSISSMSDEDVFSLIRNIRSLRRELPIKPLRKTSKKVDKKQMTIEDHLGKMKDVKKEELLKRLLEIKKRRQND
jgi:pyruvate-formate lyase-activating enzyme